MKASTLYVDIRPSCESRWDSRSTIVARQT